MSKEANRAAAPWCSEVFDAFREAFDAKPLYFEEGNFKWGKPREERDAERQNFDTSNPA